MGGDFLIILSVEFKTSSTLITNFWPQLAQNFCL
jgi:hypothetical protein